MAGDRKRVKEQDRTEEDKTNPRRILEYEFFVHEAEGETEKALPEDRNAKVVKGKQVYRNKSSIFFLD
jgi:hypothetical protein